MFYIVLLLNYYVCTSHHFLKNVGNQSQNYPVRYENHHKLSKQEKIRKNTHKYTNNFLCIYRLKS